MKKKFEDGPAKWIVIVFILFLLALFLMTYDSFGATQQLKIREYFQVRPDSVRTITYLCFDSTASAKYTAPDSIIDSVTINDQCYNNVIFKVYYPGLAPTSYSLDYFPPLFSGDARLIAETTYVKFTESTNENVFKADLTALEGAVQAVRDSVQYLVTAIGFSTFNPAIDSVLIKMAALNTSLDNDTTLVEFLRAGIGSGGLDSTTIADIIKYYVWGNIDTNLVDTSGLGEWLVNNLSGGATLTVGQIVAGVWNELQGGYTTPGSFGYFLDAQVSSIAGTAGSVVLGIFTRDTLGSIDSVGGIAVSIQDASGTVICRPRSTDTRGFIQFLVPADSILIIADGGAAYEFDLVGYTVTGNDTIAVDGMGFVAPSPTSPDKGAVWAFVNTIQGESHEGVVVTVQRSIGNATSGGAIVSRVVAEDTTDANGYFWMELIRSSQLLTSTSGRYRIEGKYRGQTQFVVDNLTIPDTGNVDLTDTIAARFGP